MREGSLVSDGLRLALVTDIHHGGAKLTKRGDAALPLLSEFARHVNRTRPDLVIDLGDRISDIDAATDRRLQAEVGAAMAQIEVPRLHLLGNHDLEHLGPADNAAALGCDMAHRVLDRGGCRIVLWQADVSVDWSRGLTATDADLDWLRATLRASDAPTVVCSHLPLDNASMEGNYYFQNNPQFAGYGNGPAIRRILRESGNVILCLAGHTHWNRLTTLDGIPFITVQSLTESFTTAGEASAAWAEVEVGDDIRWRTWGNDPIEMRLPRRGHNQRWTAPLPPLKELLRRRQEQAGLAGIRGFILDLDGVVYRGDEPIPGAAEFLAAQRRGGRRMVAVTNNAQADAARYAAKLAGMGIDFPAADILTAGEATARWLTRDGARPRLHVVGSVALRRALAAHGLGEADPAEVVVVGMARDLTMAQLMAAAARLAAGARLVATNPDAMLPVAGGGVEPESGALIAFLEAASGRRAEVVGKPGRFLYQLALERLGLPAAQVLMVGDTLATDIVGAANAGLRSALVATGNPAAEADIAPTVRVERLADLGPLLA
jgi:HAD superfamily hydrolase (TIGR01450 family)